MINWKGVFNEIVLELYLKVNPILNTKQAEEIVGNGAGGDLTRYVDALAEDIAIKVLEKNYISCIFINEERGTKKVGENLKDCNS